VRWAIVCAVLLTSATGEAQRSRRTPPPTPPPADAGDFWRDVIEPNGDRVNALLEKARESQRQLDHTYGYDYGDYSADQKVQVYRTMYRLARQARKLAPENTEVLAMLGQAADELGKTTEAIDALTAYVKLVGNDKAGAEITGRLGAIYLRLGERDTAIRYLRHSQANHTAQIHLANAFAARGEMTTAIDTLLAIMPTSFQPYAYGTQTEANMVAFALAVVYDRDEQRGAAFEILEKMQTQMQAHYLQNVLGEIAKLRFAPADDQHYFQALLYESTGQYIEARAAWALYAAAADAPWRTRALEHIAEIDRQRKKDPAFKPTQVPTTQTPPHRRRRP
jgi:tetratricopeptide (TPR) repeat protein